MRHIAADITVVVIVLLILITFIMVIDPNNMLVKEIWTFIIGGKR